MDRRDSDTAALTQQQPTGYGAPQQLYMQQQPQYVQQQPAQQFAAPYQPAYQAGTGYGAPRGADEMAGGGGYGNGGAQYDNGPEGAANPNQQQQQPLSKKAAKREFLSKPWIADRKRCYPTSNNVARREAEAEARSEAGGLDPKEERRRKLREILEKQRAMGLDSLLEKLLQRELRQERSWLLQAIRFIVRNGYLQATAPPLAQPAAGATDDGSGAAECVRDGLLQSCGLGC
eukprot:XP_001697181.1 predicted protein [Chlamydomonas reinhardtii]